MVFAVIVLFQADIRRALAHFGRAPFLRYFSRAAGRRETIEELVVAVGNLSSHRIGALIVIERQIGLRNYIEGGIPLDAMITYDLLASIFQTTSPLHDGAVIVQGDRIAAAACFLPLSVNPKVSRELGTRHRAALGLTEENDARGRRRLRGDRRRVAGHQRQLERDSPLKPCGCDSVAVRRPPPPGARPAADARSTAGLMALPARKRPDVVRSLLAGGSVDARRGRADGRATMRIPLEFTNLPPPWNYRRRARRRGRADSRRLRPR